MVTTPQNILDNPEHHKVTLFVNRDFGILGRQRQDYEEPWIRDRIRMAQAQFPRSHQELEGKKCHHLCPFTGNMAQVIPEFKLLASTAVNGWSSVFCLKSLICCILL